MPDSNPGSKPLTTTRIHAYDLIGGLRIAVEKAGFAGHFQNIVAVDVPDESLGQIAEIAFARAASQMLLSDEFLGRVREFVTDERYGVTSRPVFESWEIYDVATQDLVHSCVVTGSERREHLVQYYDNQFYNWQPCGVVPYEQASTMSLTDRGLAHLEK